MVGNVRWLPVGFIYLPKITSQVVMCRSGVLCIFPSLAVQNLTLVGSVLEIYSMAKISKIIYHVMNAELAVGRLGTHVITSTLPMDSSKLFDLELV